MEHLFQTYSSGQIFLFIIILAVAIKELINFIDWAKKRTKQAVEANDQPRKLRETNQKQNQQLEQIKEQLKELKNNIQTLSHSDRQAIKSFITRQHHYFCYQLGCIDDYSLDCIEKRYAYYKDEGGNSFIGDLMHDLRQLPKVAASEQRNHINK